jgi:hypothetical protein
MRLPLLHGARLSLKREVYFIAALYSDRKSLQMAVGKDGCSGVHGSAAAIRRFMEETMKALIAIASAALSLGACAVVPVGPPGAVYVAPAPRVAVAAPVVVVRPWYRGWYRW